MIQFRNKSLACLFTGLISSILPLISAASTTASDQKQLAFRVYLDDKEIGYHNVQLRRTPKGAEVSVDASFDIKILFFNAFSYRHNAQERWNGACLEEVRSAET